MKRAAANSRPHCMSWNAVIPAKASVIPPRGLLSNPRGALGACGNPSLHRRVGPRLGPPGAFRSPVGSGRPSQPPWSNSCTLSSTWSRSYDLPGNPRILPSSSICSTAAVSAVVRFSSNGSAGGRLYRDSRISPPRHGAARTCTAFRNAHHKPIRRFTILANPDIAITVEFELVAAVILGVIHCSI